MRVREYCGRFLKKGDDGLWYDMCGEDARKKASQGKIQILIYCLNLLRRHPVSSINSIGNGVHQFPALREDKWN